MINTVISGIREAARLWSCLRLHGGIDGLIENETLALRFVNVSRVMSSQDFHNSPLIMKPPCFVPTTVNKIGFFFQILHGLELKETIFIGKILNLTLLPEAYYLLPRSVSLSFPRDRQSPSRQYRTPYAEQANCKL